MRNHLGVRALIVLAVFVSLGACRPYPTKPVHWLTNRRPAISSIVVFPEIIGQGDSMIVTVNASDPDGDSLVYDWFTDARLIIKDAGLHGTYRYNTYSNSQVIYRSTSPLFNGESTAWVQCGPRDRRGGSAYSTIQVRARD